MSIEAMKQALEALDSKHDMTKAEWRVLQYRAFTALRAAIAEASMQRITDAQQAMEQEPVAYVTGYHDGHLVVRPIEHVVFHTGMALYRAPRTWVGLTDEEIEYLDMETSGTVFDFVRAIEAKLKEKNCG